MDARDGSEEPDEDDQVGDQDNIQRFKRLWRNERCAPALLPHDEGLIAIIKDGVDQQVCAAARAPARPRATCACGACRAEWVGRARRAGPVGRLAEGKHRVQPAAVPGHHDKGDAGLHGARVRPLQGTPGPCPHAQPPRPPFPPPPRGSPARGGHAVVPMTILAALSSCCRRTCDAGSRRSSACTCICLPTRRPSSA